MKRLLTIILILLSLNIYAQNEDEYWAKWNKNYPQVDVLEILKFERHYADSIERDRNIPPYYARLDKFRFTAEYIGATRPVAKDVFESMAQVFKLFVGDPSQLNSIFDSEVLFKVGDDQVWMPIQAKILKALQEEVKVKDKVLLYCLFLNQHTSENKLYNTFFVSEFSTD
jgi:hypothetical protein